MEVFKLAARLLDHLGQFLYPLDEIVRMYRASDYDQTGQEGEGPRGIILGKHFGEAINHIGVGVNHDGLEIKFDPTDVLTEQDTDDLVQLSVDQLTLWMYAAVQELPGGGAGELPLVRGGRDDGGENISDDKCR